MDNRSIFLAWVGGSAALGSAILIGAVGLALGLLILLRRAVRAWQASRSRRFEQHVQAALDARLVRQVEPVTEVLDLDVLERAFRRSPLHDFYLDPEELHR